MFGRPKGVPVVAVPMAPSSLPPPLMVIAEPEVPPKLLPAVFVRTTVPGPVSVRFPAPVRALLTVTASLLLRTLIVDVPDTVVDWLMVRGVLPTIWRVPVPRSMAPLLAGKLALVATPTTPPVTFKAG